MKFAWSFSFELVIDEVWVADGYEATVERIREMLLTGIGNDIGFASEHEYEINKVTVLSSPSEKSIRKVQGY